MQKNSPSLRKSRSTTKATSKVKPIKIVKRKLTTKSKPRQHLVSQSTQHNQFKSTLSLSSTRSISTTSISTPSFLSPSSFSFTKSTPFINQQQHATFTTQIISTPSNSFFSQPIRSIKSHPYQSRSFSTQVQDNIASVSSEDQEDGVAVPPELEKQYKRLLFQATQRGWLELDLIFTAYVKTHKKMLLTPQNLNLLSEVCDCDNSDLVRWFVEGTPLPDEWKKNPIMVHMLDYALQPSKPWYPKKDQGNQ